MTKDEYKQWKNLPETQEVFAKVVEAMDEIAAHILSGAIISESLEKTGTDLIHKLGVIAGMKAVIDYEVDDVRH